MRLHHPWGISGNVEHWWVGLVKTLPTTTVQLDMQSDQMGERDCTFVGRLDEVLSSYDPSSWCVGHFAASNVMFYVNRNEQKKEGNSLPESFCKRERLPADFRKRKSRRRQSRALGSQILGCYHYSGFYDGWKVCPADIEVSHRLPPLLWLPALLPCSTRWAIVWRSGRGHRKLKWIQRSLRLNIFGRKTLRHLQSSKSHCTPCWPLVSLC